MLAYIACDVVRGSRWVFWGWGSWADMVCCFRQSMRECTWWYMLQESIQNKITRKKILYLGGWKARGIPKGGFGHVLASKAEKGKKFWSAVSSSLRLMLKTLFFSVFLSLIICFSYLRFFLGLSPMVTGSPFFSTFFLSPISVSLAEKVNPRCLQLTLFFCFSWLLLSPLS